MMTSKLRVVSLISGGKESCFNMMHAVADGHEIVALANLYPSKAEIDELDSYMYQTVGHEAIDLYAEAMDLPLFRREIQGSSHTLSMDYIPDSKDEVEDLYKLLKEIKQSVPYDAVASGAILSDYQRIRVESVCDRLGLTSLSYLWRRNQKELLQEMIDCKLEAILIKTAALGLYPEKHLGQSLQSMQSTLHVLSEKYGCHICGEGGEFETFTLDLPLFKRRIVIDDSEVHIHSDDCFAPVGYLKLVSLHLEEKDPCSIPILASLPLMTSSKYKRKHMNMIEKQVNSYEPIKHFLVKNPWSQMKCEPRCFDIRAKQSGKYLIIGNLVGRVGRNTVKEDIVLEMKKAMNALQDTLSAKGHHLQNVCYVQINMSDMSHYRFINEVYKTYFISNPPARACIGCLPKTEDNENIVFEIYCISCKQEKKAMHVQGLSHWAPANIGPFSQCVLSDEFLFISGTIGLIPGLSDVIDESSYSQSSLVLRHINSAIKAMSPKSSLVQFLYCVCYVTCTTHISAAKRSWVHAHQDVPEETPSQVLYVVVNELPKKALVEWQGVVCPMDDQGQQCRTNESEFEQNEIKVHSNFMKFSWNERTVSICTCSVVASENSMDVYKCFERLWSSLHTCLKQKNMSHMDIMHILLYYIPGKGYDLAEVALKQLQKSGLLSGDLVNCIPVNNIYDGDIHSVMTCVCTIHPSYE